MEFNHPYWSCSTNIYEVNVRQYTVDGTFKAFQTHLPRLKDMGVEVLWFMPVTPISNKNRKGTLGSYYAVQNYKTVNPEFGCLRDLIELITTAHKFGFKVIIDWVANHTGNDNIWIEAHPDFFCYDINGHISHPNGWDDVSKLNYDNEQMQVAMIDAMKFWILECNIDGFRCDMAHLVPLDFWEKARTELEKIKPELLWLAECEEPEYHQVFDATYTWKWMHATEEFCKGKNNLPALFNLLNEYNSTFPKEALRVYFTSNHDENSWNGTEYEKYGEAAKAFAVFSCIWNGLPMIYSGQELPNYKRLNFFDKDVIEWKDKCDLHGFYKVLLNLRKRNSALRAGDMNVITYKIETGDERIFSFVRKNKEDVVFVIINFSPEKVFHKILDDNLNGKFKNVFNPSFIIFPQQQNVEIDPWSYLLYEKLKAL
ncbi:MAG: alpha-amylase family glycosyl hydrolase [Bacteroidota bacterium]|nr:alpha-amylase family glycosyl hydrolase [Bacteroidota bacterium]